MDPTTSPSYHTDAWCCIQWQHALLLISMDRVAPLLQRLGLNWTSPDRIREAIRRYVLAEQQLSEDAWDDDDGFGQKIAKLIDRLLAELATIEPQGDVHLRGWVEQQYIPCGHPAPWQVAWRSLLYRLPVLGTTLLIRDGMPAMQADALLTLATEWRQGEDQIDLELEALENMAKSTWDHTAYAYYQREDPTASPLTALGIYLHAQHFAALWPRVVSFLGPEGLARLERWGMMIAATTTISLAEVKLPRAAQEVH